MADASRQAALRAVPVEKPAQPPASLYDMGLAPACACTYAAGRGSPCRYPVRYIPGADVHFCLACCTPSDRYPWCGCHCPACGDPPPQHRWPFAGTPAAASSAAGPGSAGAPAADAPPAQPGGSPSPAPPSLPASAELGDADAQIPWDVLSSGSEDSLLHELAGSIARDRSSLHLDDFPLDMRRLGRAATAAAAVGPVTHHGCASQPPA